MNLFTSHHKFVSCFVYFLKRNFHHLQSATLPLNHNVMHCYYIFIKFYYIESKDKYFFCHYKTLNKVNCATTTLNYE